MKTKVHLSRNTIVAMAEYDSYVEGKTAEDILASSDCTYHGPIGSYLRVAAQVRTNQELSVEFRTASRDSGIL